MRDITHPGPDDFWLLPLGGTGEIGMNLNLYGHDGQWLMVDCGISFFDATDKNGFLQSRIIMPDIEFVRTIKPKLIGLLVTHAHEDHIGAVPHLWPEFGCTIYASKFTQQVLLNKLVRANCPAQVQEISMLDDFSIGNFQLSPVAMTHSTPETLGFVISTPAGRVFHTADWKLDADPVVGEPAIPELYQSLGSLDAVISDSTNALEPNAAVSESVVHEGLLDVIRDAPGRVVVTCFASNIARLQTRGRIAKGTGRYLGLLGHSLEIMHEAAKKAGYLQEEFEAYPSAELSYLPVNEVLLVVTGSQGQPGSALHRLAQDQHPDVHLTEADQVVFSSKTIPGNEKSIAKIVDLLTDRDIQVWQADSSNLPLHGSGHGGSPEIRSLFSWTKPKAVIPVHGEPEHLRASAQIARELGILTQLVGANGDLFNLAEGTIERNVVKAGVLTVDSYGKLVRFQAN